VANPVSTGRCSRRPARDSDVRVLMTSPIKKLDMNAVYALKTGTNEIEGKVEAWDVPMLMSAGGTYDIALEQSAGLTRIKKGLTPGNGELVEIRMPRAGAQEPLCFTTTD
jgi:hypothetical protein